MSDPVRCPVCKARVVTMEGKPWACHNCHWRAEGPQSPVHQALRPAFEAKKQSSTETAGAE